MEREKLLDKLAKLKRHAESAARIGSEAEAQAFAAAFQRLIVEHHVAAAEVDAAGAMGATSRPVEPIVEVMTEPAGEGTKRNAWLESLASIVCRAYLCRFLVRRGTRAIWIVGRASDAEVCTYVLTVLCRAARKLAAAHYRAYIRECKASGEYARPGFRRSFLLGFCQGIHERLRQEEQAAVAASSGTAIVLAYARGAVERYVAHKYRSRVACIGSDRSTNATAYSRGREAASRVPLSKGVNGAGAPRNLGSGSGS